MQTKNLTRGVRRHYRNRAIQHAFDIYWNKWDGATKTYDYNKWHDDKILLEDNAARFTHQDEHRSNVLIRAVKNAKHLRNCSCFLCSGHKEFEKIPKRLRMLAQEADDFLSLEEFEGEVGFNSAYIPTPQ